MQVEESQSSAASLDTFDGVVVPTDSADQKALIVTLMRKLKLQDIEGLEEELQEAKASAAQASTQLAAATLRCGTLEAELSAAGIEGQLANAKLRECDEQLKVLPTKVADATAALAESEAAAAAGRAEVDRLAAQLAELEPRGAAAAAEAEAAAAALSEACAAAEAKRAECEAVEATVAARRAELDEAEDNLNRLVERATAADAEAAALPGAIDATAAAAGKWAARLEKLTVGCAGRRDALDGATEALEATRAACEAARLSARAARDGLRAAQAESAALQKEEQEKTEAAEADDAAAAAIVAEIGALKAGVSEAAERRAAAEATLVEAQAAIAEFDDSATAKEIRGEGDADADADAEADRSLASLAGVPSGAALDEQLALSANSLELAAEEARAQAQAVGGYQAKVQAALDAAAAQRAEAQAELDALAAAQQRQAEELRAALDDALKGLDGVTARVGEAAAAHSAQLNDLEEGASGVRAAGAAAAQEAAARVAALREKEKAAKRFEAVRFAGEEATLQSRLEQLTQRRLEKAEAADGKSLLFQAKLEKTIGATARSGALGLLSGAEALAQALFEKKGEAKGDDEE